MISLPKISINSSHIKIVDKALMSELIKSAWLFMDSAYRWVPGGFLSFDDEDDMISSSLEWVICYDGPKPEPHDIDWQHVYAVTVYKEKFGKKAVAFGKQSLPKPGTTPYIDEKGRQITKYTLETDVRNPKAADIDFRRRRESAVLAMMKDTCKRGWCEVSDRPEQIMLGFGAHKIPAQDLIDAGVFKGKKVTVDKDGYHYTRLIKGEEHTKIALGRGFKPGGLK